jgi:hypothetical protein
LSLPSSKITIAKRPTSRWYRRWAWPVLAVTLGGLTLGLVAFRLDRSPTRGPPQAVWEEARYEPNGQLDAISLYQPDSINAWLPPAVGGNWTVEPDEDKSRVLAGAGFTRRKFTPHKDYQITLGLDLHTAPAVEVHFGLPANRPNAGTRYVLRITRGEGAIFGTREGDKGPFMPQTVAVPYPLGHNREGQPPYHEVRFERAGGRWSVRFNRREVGHANDEGVARAPELRLFADGGRARIDSVLLEPLRRLPD